jgi:hypothetical protein
MTNDELMSRDSAQGQGSSFVLSHSFVIRHWTFVI